MERNDLILLVIAAAEDRGLTPVQLQKSVFLIGESKLPGLPTYSYEFIPYNYGPFSLDVYSDADQLASEGMIGYMPVPARSWQKYALTQKGLRLSEEIETQGSEKLVKYVKEVVSWVKSHTFSDLLRAIYAKYPEFRVNSVFQG